jgi:hypothetical protein
MKLRRAVTYRAVEIRDCRQIAIVDVDHFPRVLCGSRRLRDDHRYGLAHETHLLQREHRVMRFLQLLAVLAGITHDVGKRLEARLARILAGVHRHHARGRQRPRHVDAQYFRVSAIGTQECRVELARQIPVGGITSLPRYETKIFAPCGTGMLR